MSTTILTLQGKPIEEASADQAVGEEATRATEVQVSEENKPEPITESTDKEAELVAKAEVKPKKAPVQFNKK